jgi:hypothetical protein
MKFLIKLLINNFIKDFQRNRMTLKKRTFLECSLSCHFLELIWSENLSEENSSEIIELHINRKASYNYLVEYLTELLRYTIWYSNKIRVVLWVINLILS